MSAIDGCHIIAGVFCKWLLADVNKTTLMYQSVRYVLTFKLWLFEEKDLPVRLHNQLVQNTPCPSIPENPRAFNNTTCAWPWKVDKWQCSPWRSKSRKFQSSWKRSYPISMSSYWPNLKWVDLAKLVNAPYQYFTRDLMLPPWFHRESQMATICCC